MAIYISHAYHHICACSHTSMQVGPYAHAPRMPTFIRECIIVSCPKLTNALTSLDHTRVISKIPSWLLADISNIYVAFNIGEKLERQVVYYAIGVQVSLT